MKRIVLFLVPFILILSSMPAAAQDVQELVLGVSPASATPCIGPGDSDVVKFLVSTNVDVPQNVTIDFIGPNWAEAEKEISFTNTADLLVTVSVPWNTAEDMYDIKIVICRTPDPQLEDPMTSQACVSPLINVNVTYQCAKEREEPSFDMSHAILLGVVALAVLMLLTFSRMRKGRKR